MHSVQLSAQSTTPEERPQVPFFSSGPCAKRPDWSPVLLEGALVGRSHRCKPGKARLAQVIERSAEMLGLPDGWRLGIVPASDTGAVEMALWSLIGQRGVDVLAWESFGQGWKTDLAKQLKVADLRAIEAPYGALPDLGQVDWARDVVFTWNGTTSGVKVPDGAWIADDREGLAICDATSAAFAMALPFDKLDVVTWSWQKSLGGEAGHGMLALSPRAVERLESYTPPWPLPKIFRLTKGGKLIEGVFRGETINTPSMLAVEDQLDALAWAESLGGLPALIARSETNLAIVEDWIGQSSDFAFLAADPATRSSTSICLVLAEAGLAEEAKAKLSKSLAAHLERDDVAYDIGAYRDAPPGLRLWGGPTVEAQDMAALLPWLDWALAQARADS